MRCVMAGRDLVWNWTTEETNSEYRYQGYRSEVRRISFPLGGGLDEETEIH